MVAVERPTLAALWPPLTNQTLRNTPCPLSHMQSTPTTGISHRRPACPRASPFHQFCRPAAGLGARPVTWSLHVRPLRGLL